MKKEIILIGGGGHCRSCIDVIEKQDVYHIRGIIDIKENLHKNIGGYEVVGNDSDLPSFAKTIKKYFITIGHIKTSFKRENLFADLKRLNVELPVIISPIAYVSRHATINEGTIIMHHAVVNAGAKIGHNCIINTKALIEHDVVVGDHCHISTGAMINGEVFIAEGCFVGSNATIRETIKICEAAFIGAGATVVKDIQERGTYTGNPAKRIGGL